MNELENQGRNATLEKALVDQLKGEREVNPKMKMTDAQIEDMVADIVETITPKTPIWIGAEIPTGWGHYNICIGVNQEDGHEISYCNETDIQFGKEQGYDCWNYDGKIVVKYGTDSRVFNDNHELITKSQTETPSFDEEDTLTDDDKTRIEEGLDHKG